MPIHGDAAPAGKPTYTILGPLPGGGPHTRLVLAHHEGFDRRCVQKTVFLTGPPAVLFAEPRLLDQLRGEDIVSVLDAQYDPHTPGAITFVMPYYPDGSILDALRSGHSFSLSEVVAILADLLTAVAKIHGVSYIDGDVKPGNALLWDGRTRAALSDVGSAAPVDASGTAPMVTWTWLYLAPECLPAGQRMTDRSDIYGVGLTAFELLNGMFDYAALQPPVTVPRLQRGLRAVPDRALRFGPHIPKDLRLIVQKAIAVDPGHRYSSGRAFLKNLRKLRFIDWRRTAGVGLEGVWEGTWPAREAPAKRRGYRVEVTPIRGRKLRVKATQRASAGAGWKRFGIPDATIGAADARGLSKIFSALEARARQLVPAK
jgi:serine/threonine protein kinase